MPHEREGTSEALKEAPTTSEDLVAQLLNDVKTSKQVFSVDKLAGLTEADLKVPEKSKKHKKKHKKHHKHKSKKKKKKDEKSSRKRSRSPSKKHKKKRRYSSSSSSSSSSASDDNNFNYSSSIKEEKKPIETSKEEVPTDPLIKPSSSTVDIPKVKPNIPPSKPLVDRTEDDDLPLGCDFRTKIAPKKEAPTKLAINITTVIPKVDVVEPEDGEIQDNDESDKEIDGKDIVSSEWAAVEKKSSSKSKEKRKKSSRKRSRSSSSVDTAEIIRQQHSRKSTSRWSRSRSRDRKSRRVSPRRVSPIRVRGRGETRFNKRSISRDRKTRSRSKDRSARRRSRSNERGRRRSRSNERGRRRSRSIDRSKEWRDRRRDYDEYRRKRSRSRDIVDKERLLAIAKKKRAEMYAKGERDNASIEDFVSYMHKLQKRQAREKRREKGEAVSDDDSDDGMVNYKHPYALPRADPIRINIVNAATASLAQKALPSTEEKVLDETQLRLVFPVSSGAVHKENAEWTPIIKEDIPIPKSCTNEQKKRVALTSVEIERCRQQGIPVAQTPTPTFLNSIIPPPPPPPQFLPNPNEALLPPASPPPLPPVLYVPTKDRMIMREPMDIKLPAPNDISKVLKQRADAQKKLHTNPNDFEAHRMLREANEKVELWGALKSLPGKYTGTTGLKLLTPDELQPHNPKYHAWVKRDQFKNAAPAVGGVGMRMMEMMGWKPGEGLGRDATGNLEPLVLDVKSDRRGLIAEEEMSTKQRNKLNASNNVPVDLSNKNPISLIMELCAKRRLPAPNFFCEEVGQDQNKTFVWTLTINDVKYRPLTGSRQKKEGKTIAAMVALQSMGILPRDPNLPVVM